MGGLDEVACRDVGEKSGCRGKYGCSAGLKESEPL